MKLLKNHFSRTKIMEFKKSSFENCKEKIQSGNVGPGRFMKKIIHLELILN